jgi:hypothetical protein
MRRHAYTQPQHSCLTGCEKNTHTSTPNDTISTYNSWAGRIHTLKVGSLTFLEIHVPNISRLTCKLTLCIAPREEANGLYLGMCEWFIKDKLIKT